MCDINSKTPMEKLTIGGNIYKAGNARKFKTGDWRSLKPIFNSEKCKQCGLCFPVCPEDSACSADAAAPRRAWARPR